MAQLTGGPWGLFLRTTGPTLRTTALVFKHPKRLKSINYDESKNGKTENVARFCASAFPSHTGPMYEICCQYMRVGSQRGQHILSKEKGFVIQEDLTEKDDSDSQIHLPYYLSAQPFKRPKKKRPPRSSFYFIIAPREPRILMSTGTLGAPALICPVGPWPSLLFSKMAQTCIQPGHA